LYWLLGAAIIGALCIIVWVLTKEKRILPLQNETDLGEWLLPLPDVGYDTGRLTTARKTAENQLEAAIVNCRDPKEKEGLQEYREELLKQYLFAFKGSSKWLIMSNRDLTDQKLSSPLGTDKRLLMNPETIITKGEHGGFRVVYLGMPDPDKVGVAPPSREAIEKSLEGLKYLKTVARTTTIVEEITEDRDHQKDRKEHYLEKVAEYRSMADEGYEASAIESLSKTETTRKGAWQKRLSGVLSLKRLGSATLAATITYFGLQQIATPFDPIYLGAIAWLLVFWQYPNLAKRL